GCHRAGLPPQSHRLLRETPSGLGAAAEDVSATSRAHVMSGTMRTIVATAVATATLATIGFLAVARSTREATPQRPSEIDAALAEAARAPAPVVPAAEPVTPNEPDAPPEPKPPATLEELVSRSMPAVVRVEVPGAMGSGFFIKPDLLVTNVHVVTTNAMATVRMQDGRTRVARVETTAPELDVAVLRLDSAAPGQPTLAMASAIRAKPGQEVIVPGAPLGLQNTVTRGIVSALRQVGPITLVQTDAAVNPGNSGGPVLDREGRVIGIATMSARAGVAQGLSFAVAIDHAQALLDGRRPTGAAVTPLAGLSQAMDGRRPEAPASGAPATVSPSETDARREQGARMYEQFVGQVARQADQLDAYWAQFRRVCYSGEIAGGFTRDWFALYEPKSMKGARAPCRLAQFAEMRRVADQ